MTTTKKIAKEFLTLWEGLETQRLSVNLDSTVCLHDPIFIHSLTNVLKLQVKKGPGLKQPGPWFVRQDGLGYYNIKHN